MKASTSPAALAESRAATEINEFAPRRSFLSNFRRWEWMMVALVLAVIILNSRLSPYFLNAQNLSRTSSDFMELGLMMLPMTFIIITGNIDISVASNLGMSASLMGLLYNHGVNIWLAALGALILGGLGGFLNGLLVARVKLPSLVVTLGTYAFFRGLAYGFLGDQAATNYPATFTYLGQGLLPGTLIPFSVALFVILAAVFGLVLHKTTFGRYLYVIGNNQKAAIYSGVPIDRIKIILFTLSGFMAALAGLILASRFGSTRPDIGTGLELAVITAAVLGGVDINGGTGSMIGAVLSLILIGLIRFGMGLVNIQGQVQGIVIGLLLICAILFPNLAVQASAQNLRVNRPSILYAIGMIFLIVIFIYFFFWSRAPIIASS
jgi:rhamnose transport system permease protein